MCCKVTTMNKRIVIAVALVCVIAFAAPALPLTLAPEFMGLGVLIGYDMGMGSVRLDFEIYVGLLDNSILPEASHFGVGFTIQYWMRAPLIGMSLDGLYWWGPDSSGSGSLVVPIKLDLGVALGRERLFGVGLAAGVEDYAVSLGSGTYLTLKALGEIDAWSNGEINPSVMAGSVFDFQPPSGGDYYTYYYY